MFSDNKSAISGPDANLFSDSKSAISRPDANLSNEKFNHDIIHSDNHVHTYFSTDSDTPMEEMLKTAIDKRFTSICFTDHMDYNFPSESDTPEFLLDVEPYFDEMKKLSEKYSDRIKIRKGIELGLKKDCLDKCLSLTKNYPFDFVIGSTHLVDNIDPYYDIFWVSESVFKTCRVYLYSFAVGYKCF